MKEISKVAEISDKPIQNRGNNRQFEPFLKIVTVINRGSLGLPMQRSTKSVFISVCVLSRRASEFIWMGAFGFRLESTAAETDQHLHLGGKMPVSAVFDD